MLCINITIGEAAEFIKMNNIKIVNDWMESDKQCVGDKCEACHEDGTENDGVTLAVILSQVKPKLCNRKLKILSIIALKAHLLKIQTTNKVA